MSELTDYIEESLVQLDYGRGYVGINEPNMTQLFIIKGMIEASLFNLRNELLANNEKQS